VYKHNYTHISHPHEEIEDIIKAVNWLLTYLYSMEGKNYKSNVQSLKLTFSGYSMKNLHNYNLVSSPKIEAPACPSNNQQLSSLLKVINNRKKRFDEIHSPRNEMQPDSIQMSFRPA